MANYGYAVDELVDRSPVRMATRIHQTDLIRKVADGQWYVLLGIQRLARTVDA